jgi:hypothetical protein
MNAELNQHIDDLRHLTTAQLKLKYRELFGQPSHSNHKDYLFRRVAWCMQALAEGGLSERARQCAQEIATDADLRLCAPKRVAKTLFGCHEEPLLVADWLIALSEFALALRALVRQTRFEDEHIGLRLQHVRHVPAEVLQERTTDVR